MAKRKSFHDAADEVVIGTDAREQLDGTAGNDQIYGLGGNDVLRGHEGSDTLYGGDGNDQLRGGSGRDTLRGEDGNDYLYGGYGGDKLYGNHGYDQLDGGAGADMMIGGTEGDFYIVDNAGDTVVENADDDGWDVVQSSVSYAMHANVEELRLTGDEDLEAWGNELSNRLYGNDGDNVLWGGDGDDMFEFSLGNDTLIGGAGNDSYQILTGLHNPVIVEEADGGIDEIFGSGNLVLGANIENAYVSSPWDQALTMTGNELDNFLQLRNDYEGPNEVYGNDGNDHIILTGGGSAYGGNGNDFIEVFSFVQHYLYGGAGNDTLEGYLIPVYTGGEGADHFRFRDFKPWYEDAPASVTDFKSGVDTLELSDWMFSEGQSFTADNFYSGPGAVAQDADDRLIFDTDTGMLYYDSDGTGEDTVSVIAQIYGDAVTFNDIAVVNFSA